MKLTMLGTGNAVVTACYNTCFVLQKGGRYFLVDGGGGNTLLLRLKQADIDWRQIRTVFVTHKHMDHILGILWMMRLICQGMARGEYEGDAVIYGHREVIGLLEDMAGKLLHEKQTQFIGRRLHLVAVEDGEQQRILGRPVTFFDIGSTKDRQFGFSMELGEEKRLTCCGDEPYHDCEERYVRGSDWLLHEAFCLSSQADVFRPYEKHHSTVADACRLAQSMGVKNLVLYHTEDKNIRDRKALYTQEGREFFLWQALCAGGSGGDRTMKENYAFTIESAVPEDAEELVAIYDYYVQNTAITFEYETPHGGRVPPADREYPGPLSLPGAAAGRPDPGLCLCRAVPHPGGL